MNWNEKGLGICVFKKEKEDPKCHPQIINQQMVSNRSCGIGIALCGNGGTIATQLSYAQGEAIIDSHTWPVPSCAVG